MVNIFFAFLNEFHMVSILTSSFNVCDHLSCKTVIVLKPAELDLNITSLCYPAFSSVSLTWVDLNPGLVLNKS